MIKNPTIGFHVKGSQNFSDLAWYVLTLIYTLFLVYFIGSKNKIIRAEKYGNSHFCEVPKFVHNKHTKN